MKKITFLFFFLLFISITVNAQYSALVEGDIAFIGVNEDPGPTAGNDHSFTWVALKDIPASEVIYFTEEGWRTRNTDTGIDPNFTYSGYWAGTNEGHFQWTAPAGGLSKGSIVHIYETGTNVMNVIGGGTVSGILSGTGWNLSSGDQVLAYQTSSGARPAGLVPTFISGIHLDDGRSPSMGYDVTTGWSGLAENGGVAYSNVPPGLTNGFNCISLFNPNDSRDYENDNVRYKGITTGTKTQLMRAINSDYAFGAGNWSADNDVPYDITSTGYSTFTVSPNTSSSLGSLVGATVELVELSSSKTVNGSDDKLSGALADYNTEFSLDGGTKNLYTDVDATTLTIGGRNGATISVNAINFNFSGGTFGAITGASINTAESSVNTSGLSISFTANSIQVSGLIGFDFASSVTIGAVVFDIVTSGAATVAPTVSTTAASSIVATSATLAGNATADGGASITERGYVYSLTATNSDPLINGLGVTKNTDGTGTGVFTESITGLTESTGYSYKAYATNAAGTSYGLVQTFTTSAAADVIEPRISSVVRQSPTTSPTNADALVWDVTFDEAVSNVSVSDFSVIGTTATIASVTNPSGNVYRVTTSGGDLAGLNGTVILGFAGGQDITDASGNALTNLTPTGTNNNTFVVENTTVLPTITFTNINKTYGNADFDLAATSNSASDISYSIIGEANGTSLSGTNNKTVSLGNAGTVTIRAIQTANGEFTSGTKDITLTINKASLTVTANTNQSKTYGATEPILTYTITGFVNGDVEADLDTPVSISRIAGENAANYTITPAAAADANYTVSFVANTFKINPVAITVIADAKSKTYGDADPALTYQITTGSLVTGDTFTGSLSREAGETVNTYAISSSLVNTNYNITFVSADVTITKKAITITADELTKDFGDSDPTLTYTINPSLVDNDELTGSLSRAAGEDVGTYAISSTLANSNYQVTFVSADFTITSKVVVNPIKPSLKPAEAFTPNGDGINDTWVIPNIYDYPNNTVQVYNRSGHEVYKKRNYQNDWNGSYESASSTLPSGSYLYIIDLGNGSTLVKGWIFINY